MYFNVVNSLQSYDLDGRVTLQIGDVKGELVTLVHEDELPLKKDGGRKDTSVSKNATLLGKRFIFGKT